MYGDSIKFEAAVDEVTEIANTVEEMAEKKIGAGFL